MASKLPPVKNAAYTFRCVLFAQLDNQIKSNPTIASGDWKVSTDGAAFANLATLPDVDPDGSVQVKVSLSADEMNGDEIMVTAIDAAGDEWHSAAWVIHTAAQTLDTMDANIDSALADTNELQNDWADDGRLDLILDARSSQTSVDDLPTNAELATALGTADDATLAAIAALTIPSAATVADAVWDEATAGHAGLGSTGAALTAAGAAGDPWATTLPGAYTGEQAGNIIDRIDAQLATSAAALISAVTDGDNLTGYRGDSFTVNFTDLGNVAARTKLWFTAKRKASDADDDAMIQIEETGDLLYINGAAAETAANGSLTVTDAATGDMTLVLAAVESAKMPVDKTLVYDIQMLTASGVSTLAAGTLAFSADVTRAVS